MVHKAVTFKDCMPFLADLTLSHQGFQYFSSVPVLHYLQVVLYIKIWTIFMNILYNTLSIQELPKTMLGR